ncbi:hypothetical protein, partial [Shigella sonnei]|uniref:hypothetical protein n=1 Tax=Shigella sonnei TaxID=624 RepID=UPI001C2EC5DF
FFRVSFIKIVGVFKFFFLTLGSTNPPGVGFPPRAPRPKTPPRAPGESGFTVTMRLTVQPSGSAFMHESSGTVAPIIDVSGRSDNFR